MPTKGFKRCKVLSSIPVSTIDTLSEITVAELLEERFCLSNSSEGAGILAEGFILLCSLFKKLYKVILLLRNINLCVVGFLSACVSLAKFFLFSADLRIEGLYFWLLRSFLFLG